MKMCIRDRVNAFLEESVQLSEIVMGDAAYSLWNYNNVAAMKNLSSRYLFNIEEEASNCLLYTSYQD